MAQALGVLLFGSTTGLSVAGVALTTGAGALTLAGVAFNVGASLLATTALQAVQGGGTTPKPEDVIQNFQSTISPRVVHMGRAKVGGSMMFPPRTKDGKIYILLAQMHGEIAQRTKHFIDGREVTLWEESSPPYVTPAGPEGGYVGEDQYQHGGRSMVEIRLRDGTTTQTANPELIAAFSDWTDDHRARGVATALIIAETPPSTKFNGMFPNRTPQYSCEGDWHKVLDPRTGVTASSENPIVHLRDYMLSQDGMGLSSDGLNETFNVAMSDCDENLSTGPRYRIGGTYRLTDSPKDVIAAILQTCDGAIYRDAEGKFGVRVGTEISAPVTLSSDHLISVLDWSNGNSLLQGYTSLKPQYTDQSLGFSTITIDPWVDADLVARYRQETFGSDPGFLLVPHHVQARFLSKIKTKKDNPIFSGTLRFDLHGLRAIGEEYINIDLDFEEFGVDYSGPAKVENIKLAGGSNDSPDSLSYVDITVSVIDPNTYSRSLEEEGAAPTLAVSDTGDSFPVVVNLGAGPSGVQTAQNTYSAGIGVSWDLPTQTSLSSVIRYSPAGQDTWTEVSVPSGVGVYQITGLVDNAQYDVGHAWETPAATVGDFTDLTNITASAVVGTPDAPASLTATDQSGGSATIQFQASASNTTWKTEILRDSVVIYSQATSPSQVVTFTDIPGAGTYTYEARTIDVAANVSPLLSTTPAATTIT